MSVLPRPVGGGVMDILEREHELEMERARRRSPWADALPWCVFWVAFAAVIIVAILSGWHPWETW